MLPAGWQTSARTHALLIVGLAAVMIPTLVRLANQSWTLEIGAHGPIVLATGLWLIWHSRDDWRAAAGQPLALPLLVAGMAASAIAYAAGRALDLLVIEASAAYAIFLLTVARFIGFRGIMRTAFPFLYLAFLIPPPGWIIDTLTISLREWISVVSTGLLDWAGYPIAREGVVMTIGSYQLLVEDACSGMNSLVGLTAISLFYIFMLHRANWRHTAALVVAIIPVAIIANIVRVLALILVTYHFGDGVAQGVFHNLAGMVLFGLALGLMVLADKLILPLTRRRPADTAGITVGRAR